MGFWRSLNEVNAFSPHSESSLCLEGILSGAAKDVL